MICDFGLALEVILGVFAHLPSVAELLFHDCVQLQVRKFRGYAEFCTFDIFMDLDLPEIMIDLAISR